MSDHFATHRPLLMSTNWMITADHPYAVQAGAAVLESGGNAVDAAIAYNLVMTTGRSHMCGFGAGLFMRIHMATKGTFDALNASGGPRQEPSWRPTRGSATSVCPRPEFTPAPCRVPLPAGRRPCRNTAPWDWTPCYPGPTPTRELGKLLKMI